MKTHIVQERTDQRDWIARRENEPFYTQPTICQVKLPMGIAATAHDIAKHLAMVAGESDGEDSSGRQKLRLMTPEEVATRACDIAEAMWTKFEARGWILDVPEPRLVTPEKKKDEDAA